MKFCTSLFIGIEMIPANLFVKLGYKYNRMAQGLVSTLHVERCPTKNLRGASGLGLPCEPKYCRAKKIFKKKKIPDYVTDMQT